MTIQTYEEYCDSHGFTDKDDYPNGPPEWTRGWYADYVEDETNNPLIDITEAQPKPINKLAAAYTGLTVIGIAAWLGCLITALILGTGTVGTIFMCIFLAPIAAVIVFIVGCLLWFVVGESIAEGIKAIYDFYDKR